jgi:uncharacterized protein HemY
VRRAFAFLGLIVAAPVGLVALFLMLYRGEGGDGDVYVELGEAHVDADVVGFVLLAIAASMIFFSLRSLRRSGVP